MCCFTAEPFTPGSTALYECKDGHNGKYALYCEESGFWNLYVRNDVEIRTEVVIPGQNFCPDD